MESNVADDELATGVPSNVISGAYKCQISNQYDVQTINVSTEGVPERYTNHLRNNDKSGDGKSVLNRRRGTVGGGSTNEGGNKMR